MFFVVSVFADKTISYTSPNGALQAVVTTTPNGESDETVILSRGRVLLKHIDDGHGVDRAKWTADSQFLVVSTGSYGGHQPWSEPIWVYWAAKNRIFELWKFGLASVDDFTLKSPDRVQVPILGCTDREGDDRVFTFDLRRFVTEERLEISPCPDR